MGRDTTKLHPYLLDHFKRTADEYAKQYPDSAQPIIAETYRSPEEQTALYAQGRESLAEVNRLRSIAGMAPINLGSNSVVTHARQGKSRHNELPSTAYDIAFVNKAKKLDWSEINFRRFALLAKKDPQIEWGGDWPSPKRDLPHFQLKR